MPEELQHNHHEHHHDSAEQLSAATEAEQNLRRVQEAAKDAEHDPFSHSLGALRERVEHQAKSTHEHELLRDDSSSTHTIAMHRKLKDDAYQRTLQKTRPHLSPTEQVLSRVVHQPTVETVSNIAAGTIGRPSGLLAGSLFALLGNMFLLFMSRRYGFSYNYALFIICFIGGFALGLLIEIAWRLIRRRA